MSFELTVLNQNVHSDCFWFLDGLIVVASEKPGGKDVIAEFFRFLATDRTSDRDYVNDNIFSP